MVTFEAGYARTLVGTVDAGTFEAGAVDVLHPVTERAIRVWELPYELPARVRFYPLGSFEYGMLDIIAGVVNIPLYTGVDTAFELPYDVAGAVYADRIVRTFWGFVYDVQGTTQRVFEFAYRISGVGTGRRYFETPYKLTARAELSCEMPYRLLGPFEHFGLMQVSSGLYRGYDFRYSLDLPADTYVVPHDAPVAFDPQRGLLLRRREGHRLTQVLWPVPLAEWAIEAELAYEPKQVNDEGGLIVWGEGERAYLLACTAPVQGPQRLRLTCRDGIVSGWSLVSDRFVYHGRHRVGDAGIVGAALVGLSGEDLGLVRLDLYTGSDVRVGGLFAGMTARLVDDDGKIVAQATVSFDGEEARLSLAHRPWPVYGRLQIWGTQDNLLAESLRTAFFGGDVWVFSVPLELYLDEHDLIDPADLPMALRPGEPRRLRLRNPTDAPTPPIRVRIIPPAQIELVDFPVRLHPDEHGSMRPEMGSSLELGVIEAGESVAFWIDPIDDPQIPEYRTRQDFALAIEVIR